MIWMYAEEFGEFLEGLNLEVHYNLIDSTCFKRVLVQYTNVLSLAVFKMGVTLESFKEYNATMEIPGDERYFLSKTEFRKVCDEVGETEGKSLIFSWPNSETIGLIYSTLSNPNREPPKDLGQKGHKYFQTGEERAQFK